MLKSLFLKLLVLAALVALAAFIFIQPELSIAKELSVGLVCALLVVTIMPGQTARIVYTTLCAWIVVRYIGWRFSSFDEVSVAGFSSALAGGLLLAAEVYGCAMLLLGLVVNALPLNRKAPKLPRNIEDYPTVDIYIPTYSEPMSIVAPTIMGALEIDYPAAKKRVYILDDGYPRSKNSKDPKQAHELAQRSIQLQEFAKKHGAIWIGRENNNHAKSGNLNNAMNYSNGELLLILDADHVPTKDFLTKTVGFFTRDEKLAFVQTPHFFLNPDPIERNLGFHNKLPAENDMFYRAVQKGLDLWNASFFCGSAAVIRRKAVESIGGFAYSSITEDAASSIKMHQKGWKSAYYGRPMVAGLQPESFGAFIVQRLRWATGMMQIFVQQNPLLVRGLTLGQRLSYLSVILFWLFPLARSVFFIAPFFAIFFNMSVYPLGLDNFAIYTAPYILAVVLSFNKLFGKVRAFLTSELYETLQSFYILPALITTLLRPSKPTFKVTPKGIQTTKQYISEFSAPFYAVFALTTAGLLFGFWRMFTEPDSRLAIGLTVFWLVFNFILLLGALGAILESPQRRERPRVDINEAAFASFGAGQADKKVIIKDVNESGALLENITGEEFPDSFILKTSKGEFLVQQVSHRKSQLQKGSLAIIFKFRSAKEERNAVMLAYSDADRWEEMWNSRQASSFLPYTLMRVVILFIRGGLAHFKHLANKDL